MTHDLAVTTHGVLPPLRAFLVSGFKSNLNVIPAVLANGVLQGAIERPSTEVQMAVDQAKLFLTFNFKDTRWHSREFAIACMENWHQYFTNSIPASVVMNDDLTARIMVARVGTDNRVMFAWLLAGLFPTQLERDYENDTLKVTLVASKGIQSDNGGNLTQLTQNMINNRLKAAKNTLPL